MYATSSQRETRRGEPSPGLLALQRLLSRCNFWLAQSVFIVAAALLVVLSSTLFLQVLFRYVIKQPLPWTEEAARYALVWYAMLAAAAGAWGGQHFVFRWATLLLGEKSRLFLRLIVTVLTLAVLGAMLVVSWQYLDVVRGQTTIATRLDMRIPYSGVPLGLSCFFVVYLLDLADGLISLRTGQTFSMREAVEKQVYAQLGAIPLLPGEARPGAARDGE
jgi:TRAP-type C4-dicarboxylate transport system permease small subunit